MTDTIWPPDFSKTSGPKYIALIQSLRAAIRSGELPAGHKMLPVRELAWQTGITPGTVARAYRLATEEGLVEAIVGRGTFVSGERAAAPVLSPLINGAETGAVNLRSAQVPNVGQTEIIGKLLQDIGRKNSSEYFSYPTEFTDKPLRDLLVNWIGVGRAGPMTAEDIVLALGAQNATFLALQSILHGAAPIILTEALAYTGVRHAARLLRAKLIGIEMDDQGIRPDSLEQALREHGAQVLITSAEAHSPTATVTSAARRREIVALARQYKLPIIEDDCHCINWRDKPSYRVLAPDLAWYVSSLSKSVSSSLRIGYMVPPQGQASYLRHVAQAAFYGLPQPMLDLGEALLRTGQAEQIRTEVVAQINARRLVAEEHLSAFDIRSNPDVSFVWLKLPQGWRASSFCRACEKVGINVKAADEFGLPDGASPNAVRIGISVDISESRFAATLQKLATLLANPPQKIDV